MTVEDPEPKPEVDVKPELGPEVDVKPELGPEVIAELVQCKKRFSFGPQKLKSSPETLVDLPAEPTIELIPSLATMRASLSLKSPDEDDP